MTRIDIINSNLATLQAEKLTAVGSVLRLINRRIITIQNVLLREMNYPHNSQDLSSASLNTKFNKADVLDIKWLNEHELTAEQLTGKVFDASVVKGLLDDNSNAIKEKMDASVVMTTSLFLEILGLSEGSTELLSFVDSLTGTFEESALFSSRVIQLLFKEVLGRIQDLSPNYDENQFTILPSGKVGINTASPIENLHLKWGHFLIEGGNLKFKNGVNTTLNFVNFDDANIFNVANNLLKLDPTWGSTALKIDGGLVSSNVPIFINNSANHLIVMTANGNCRKIVVADDGTISTVIVPHP